MTFKIALAGALLALGFMRAAVGAPENCPSSASVAAPPKVNAQSFESPAPGDRENARVLIVGDSIAARWTPDIGVSTYNFGHGGDRTQWMLWRLDQPDLGKAKFQSAVIIAGTNNSGRLYQPCEIADGVLAIVAKLKEKFGIGKIVVVSMLPRGPGLSRNENNIEQGNQILQAKAAEGGYQYVDAFSRFRTACGHENACGLYLPGLIHPSPSGYRIFDELVRPLVN